jgi:ABC-type polysaccharide/polyol phosphate transport system ATPase subunit
MNDVLVKVEGVSKKFCRSLKRSLWYGVQDVFADLNPFSANGPMLYGDSLSAVNQRSLPIATERLRPNEFWAVNDVSFELRRGECIGLIGHNGAGKTTLLKLLNGLIKPDEGRIEMRGRVGALIALGAGFNPILTGRENIYVNGSVLGLSRKEIDARFDEIVDFSGLEEFIDTPVQSYSSGMQVRLGFAVATATQPNILLVDEVLAVGDASFQSKCVNVIKNLQKKGVAIILVSHDLHNILRYCQSGLYLKRGQVAATGPIDAVTADYRQEQDSVTGKLDVSHPMYSGHVPVLSDFELGKVYAVDCEGRPRETLSADSPVILVLPVKYKERPHDEIEVELAIDDPLGLLYDAISSPLELPPTVSEDCLEIRIRIDQFPLTDTKLTVGVAVWTAGHGVLLGWSRNNQFRFRGNGASPGRIALPACWEIVFVRREKKIESDESKAVQALGRSTKPYSPNPHRGISFPVTRISSAQRKP